MEIYKKRRTIVWKIFDALNCTYDTTIGGMFVWAKLPASENAAKFTDNLLYKKDVFITPGTIFGSKGEGYIRFSLCATTEDLEEAITRVI